MFITKIAIETMGKRHQMNIFVFDKCIDSKHTAVEHTTHTTLVLYYKTPKMLRFSRLSLYTIPQISQYPDIFLFDNTTPRTPYTEVISIKISGASFRSLAFLTQHLRRVGNDYKRTASNDRQLATHPSHHQHEIRVCIGQHGGFEGFNQGIGGAKPNRHEIQRDRNKRQIVGGRLPNGTENAI